MCGDMSIHGTRVAVRKQLVETGPFLLLCGPWGLSSGCQAAPLSHLTSPAAMVFGSEFEAMQLRPKEGLSSLSSLPCTDSLQPLTEKHKMW